jgi:hypothetical protein
MYWLFNKIASKELSKLNKIVLIKVVWKLVSTGSLICLHAFSLLTCTRVLDGRGINHH